MSANCTGYRTADSLLVPPFSCPKPEGNPAALFCCGFNDVKYCCDDPDSFFPYDYNYMWWLSLGALVGLSIAAVVLLAFFVSVCVLCYLFISTKPSPLDNGLPLRPPGLDPGVAEDPPRGPPGCCKHFLSRKLDCDRRAAEPERLFQRRFMATVNAEGP